MAKKTTTTEKNYIYATGRRKKSVARVRILPGTGKITINGRDINDLYKLDSIKAVINQPFVVSNTTGKYDVITKVIGGGFAGQAGAIRHGLSRALVKADEDLKPAIKKAGLLTRDSRMKERKKCGLKKARKAPQFSKR